MSRNRSRTRRARQARPAGGVATAVLPAALPRAAAAPEPRAEPSALLAGWRLFGPEPLLAVICGLLALVPVAHITALVMGTGANNPSNDYLGYMPFINRILSGHYLWQDYFKDTMSSVHSLAIPFAVRLAVISLTHWNMYAELAIGLVLAVLRLLFFFDALTCRARSPWRWVLLPILAALVFSTSQISDFGYGDASLPIGFTQLGLAGAVWALARFGGSGWGVALAALGGAIGTISGAGGIPIWPVLLLGIALLTPRRWRSYLVVTGAAGLALLPYMIVLLIQQHGGGTGIGSLLDLSFITAAIGWPFSEFFSRATATSVGLLGLAFTLTGLALLWLPYRPARIHRAAPALMVLAYGLINIWSISVVRGSGIVGLAPWYTTHFMPVWIGLVGLAYLLWVEGAPWRALRSWAAVAHAAAGRLWSLGLIALLAALYLNSNLTAADKAMYLFSRSPASASCLRNYATAPTTCEAYLFQWGIGHPVYLADLGAPLARHQLSVFAPDQQWALQGDYALDTVRLEQPPSAPQPVWSSNLNGAPWADYHHLDLTLPTADRLSWRLTLPARTQRASFDTALRLVGVASTAHIALRTRHGVTTLANIPLLPGGNWLPLHLPLQRWRGQTVTLLLSARSSLPSQPATVDYRYPVINLHLASHGPAGPPIPPEVVPTTADYRFPLHDWSAEGLRGGSPGAWTVTSPDALLSTTGQRDVCLSRYADLYLRLAVPPTSAPAVVQVSFALKNAVVSPISIPLLADGATHAYFTSLKLLQFPPGTRLSGLSLQPNPAPYSNGVQSIRLDSVRLIRDPAGVSCGK